MINITRSTDIHAIHVIRTSTASTAGTGTNRGQGFPYRSELNRHAAVHSDILPYPCTTCDKHFAQKKSLKRHENIHTNTLHKCDKCEKVCTTPDHLYSHQRGAHGKGYISKCGKFQYQWPAGRACHQDVCDECQNIIAEEYKCKFVKGTVPKPAKKLKVETSQKDTVEDLKERVHCKIENILRIKTDMS